MEKEKNEKEPTLKQRRQRKLYLVLPALALPFLCLFFHALGGGKEAGNNEAKATVEGLNTNLPEASADKRTALDKMGMYSQAEKDSLEWRKAVRNDPYMQVGGSDTRISINDLDGNSSGSTAVKTGFSGGRKEPDYHEQRVNEKLMALNTALNTDQLARTTPITGKTASTSADPPVDRGDIDRLEKIMEMMQGGRGDTDPEMDQINRTLESILDIQHPQRVEERLRKTSEEHHGLVFSVSPLEDELPIGMLGGHVATSDSISTGSEADRAPGANPTGFYGLDEQLTEEAPQNAIEAVVNEDQEVMNGSTVKLRLANDIFINGNKITAGSFVYGEASLRGQRLEISIESIRSGTSLYPVKLVVHDLDGLSGIRIRGSIAQDAAKQSGSQTISGISPGMLDPSLGAQAASAGIELSKNLMSKKIKLIKVPLKSGYRVLLKDGKQKG